MYTDLNGKLHPNWPVIGSIALWAAVALVIWKWVGFDNAYTWLINPWHFGIIGFVAFWLFAILAAE